MQKLKNEQGVIMMMTIIFLTLFLLIMGIVADYMKVFVIKRELQDALDAAVISAAQTEGTQIRSNYLFNKGEYICTTKKKNGVTTTTCKCENWMLYTMRDHVSVSDPR